MMTNRWFQSKTDRRRSRSYRRVFLPMGLEALERRACMANDMELAGPILLAFGTTAPTTASSNDVGRPPHIPQLQVLEQDCWLTDAQVTLRLELEQCMDPSMGPRPAPQGLIGFDSLQLQTIQHWNVRGGSGSDSLVVNAAGPLQLTYVSRPQSPAVPQLRVGEGEGSSANAGGDPQVPRSRPADPTWAEPGDMAGNATDAALTPVNVPGPAVAGQEPVNDRTHSFVSAIDWSVPQAMDQSHAVSDTPGSSAAVGITANDQRAVGSRGAWPTPGVLQGWTALQSSYPSNMHDGSAGSDVRPHLVVIPVAVISEAPHSQAEPAITGHHALQSGTEGYTDLLAVELDSEASLAGPAEGPSSHMHPTQLSPQETIATHGQLQKVSAVGVLTKEDERPAVSLRSRWWYLATIPAFFLCSRRANDQRYAWLQWGQRGASRAG